jgi:hypothetical protein
LTPGYVFTVRGKTFRSFGLPGGIGALLAAWDGLPDATKASILATVEAVSGPSKGGEETGGV